MTTGILKKVRCVLRREKWTKLFPLKEQTQNIFPHDL